MQLNPLQDRTLSTPPPLPGPALVDRLLFESPFLLPTPLVVAAVVAVFVMNARAKLVRGLLMAGVLLAAAGGVFALATFVTTPREAVAGRTRELVNAVARADTQAVGSLLAEDAEIRFRDFAAPNRTALLAAIRLAMGPGGRYELQSWRISELQATIDGRQVARSQVLVRATHKATALPASAWVLMHWELDQDAKWRCFAIEPLDAD